MDTELVAGWEESVSDSLTQKHVTVEWFRSAAFEADPQTGLVLMGAVGVVFSSAAMAGGVMSATASVVMFRTKTFPKGLAWVSLVCGRSSSEF